MHTSTSARDTDATADSVVESLLFSLLSLGRVMRQRMQGEGVDPGTYWLLKTLAGHEALRVTELAALANLDASTMSRHVAQLDRSGLVERSQDPADGRAQRVAISPAGRELLDQGLARRRAVLSRGLIGWDERDIETFGALLSRYVQNIDSHLDRPIDSETGLEHP